MSSLGFLITLEDEDSTASLGNPFLSSKTLMAEITKSLAPSSLLPPIRYLHTLAKHSQLQTLAFFSPPHNCFPLILVLASKADSSSGELRGWHTELTMAHTSPSVCSCSDHIYMTKPCCASQCWRNKDAGTVGIKASIRRQGWRTALFIFCITLLTFLRRPPPSCLEACRMINT